VLLKISLTVPKLLYILRTTHCSENPLLVQFGNTLRTGLSTVRIVELNDAQWLQDSLPVPVGNGGLGVRSSQMLALSFCLLASAASTCDPQQAILSPSLRALADTTIASAETTWAAFAGAS